MACCPKCNAKLEPMDTVCSECGYDFPPKPNWDQRKDGLAYTEMADPILMLATFVCVVAAIIFGIGSIASIAQFHVPYFLLYLASSIVSLALAVTFVRVLSIR